MAKSSRDRLAEMIAEILTSRTGRPVSAEDVRRQLKEPPNPELGDVSFPTFPYAKELKESPAAVSAGMVERLGDLAPGAWQSSSSGPYVNVTFPKEDVASEVLREIWEARSNGRPYARSEEGAGSTVVIEYSSPNIAKPFGIGHLRSTVIGQALVRLYEAAGYRVVKLNYPGDWGTQFGFILTEWQLRYAKEPVKTEKRLEKEGISFLVELYQAANSQADREITPGEATILRFEETHGPYSGSSYREFARVVFKNLEDEKRARREGDLSKLWQRFRDLSLVEFQRVYDLLGVEFDSLDGEAATQPFMNDALGELSKRDLPVESEGAYVVELGLGDNVPPAMIHKSDGATTYLARDLAEILNRHKRFGFEKCIYVVGRDQELHFRQLFRVIELMGYEWADRCIHVPFGMIRFGGGKMRTRTGSTIGLEDVLDRAFEEVRRIVETRKKGAELTDDQQKKASENVATGAVIFADLSRRRIKDYDFDWGRAFSLDGDSGPYLQYAHARACGILKKAGREVAADVDFAGLGSDPERALLKALGRYPDAVAAARRENEPAMLASHIVDVGSALNLFYNKCRVLGEERPIEDARLFLVWAAREVMAEGLGMLGIAAPESM